MIDFICIHYRVQEWLVLNNEKSKEENSKENSNGNALPAPTFDYTLLALLIKKQYRQYLGQFKIKSGLSGISDNFPDLQIFLEFLNEFEANLINIIQVIIFF